MHGLCSTEERRRSRACRNMQMSALLAVKGMPRSLIHPS